MQRFFLLLAICIFACSDTNPGGEDSSVTTDGDISDTDQSADSDEDGDGGRLCGDEVCEDGWVCIDDRCIQSCEDPKDCLGENERCVEDICVVVTINETTDVSYIPSDEVLLNPERGFTQWVQLASYDPHPITVEQLERYRDETEVTVVQTYFYIRDFYDAPISDEYLQLLRDHFDIVREAGFKIIPRFTYNRDLPDRDPPFHDAIYERIFEHIDQLEPILQENSDIMMSFQAGFIGIWGEWAFSDDFGYIIGGDDERADRYSDYNIERRGEVLHALLDAMPNNTVSIRVPAQKALIFGVAMPDGALTAENAFDGSDLSRLGHHNDCFLNNEHYSTFYYDTKNQWEYFYRDSLYSIVGGETCSDNPTFTNCPYATGALEDEHYTYLHLNYHPDAIQRFRDEGCFSEIHNRLGYRFELVNGRLSERINQGGVFSLDLNLRNVGYAAPVNSRGVELVFRDQSTDDEFFYSVDEDPRFWLAGENTNIFAEIPVSLPQGIYDVFLNLHDPAERLRDDPRYSIRLANQDLWEPERGYNSLDLTLIVE